MRAYQRLFRLTATTALTSLMLATMAPAYAQTPPPPPPDTASGLPALPAADATAQPAGQQEGDPPARVGSVSALSGTVSFHTGDADHWDFATLNYPVTSGNSFWTQPNASTDLDLGDARITLDQSTQFAVDTLLDGTMNTTLSQGRIFVLVRRLDPGQVATLRTPRGVVSFETAGRYEIFAGDTQTPTLVTVIEGRASVGGPNVNLQIAAGQTGQISGSDPFEGVTVAEVPDAFLRRQLARLQGTHVVVPNNLPPVVTEMTGYDEVATTGQWQESQDYGQVWYPPVAADWVPYRDGHWSYVAPWGWTWVDNASWGFAPFHYGRWAQVGSRWGWIPVAPGVAGRERPVYAPALVTFLGAAGAVAVGVGIGAAVGWIPLGPREVYRPPYRVSNNYVRQVNSASVTNFTNGNTVNTRYVNNNFRTVVPASTMQRSLPVAAQLRSAPQFQNANLQPLARPPVQPTLATRGVTPSVAREMNLRPTPNAPAPRQPAGPGPGFQPRPPIAAVAPPIPARAEQNVPRPQQGGPVNAAVPAAPAPARPNLSPAAPQPARPAPEIARPAPQIARPAPEIARPAPQIARPAPEIARPAPQPARPAPEIARPAPQIARPAPEIARPAPQPARPAPEIARPAPQIVRPAPEIARPAPAIAPPQISRPAAPQQIRPQPARPEAKPGAPNEPR